MINVKPILFSSGMVKAQTRRVIEPYEVVLHPFKGNKPAPKNLIQLRLPARLGGFIKGPVFKLQYGVGDLLWVREAWKATAIHDQTKPRDLAPATPIYFTADDRLWPVARYRPRMHMPRWASRLTLEVTDVRVQRLQEISEEDAMVEGVERLDPTPEDEEWNRRWCEEESRPVEPLHPVWTAPGTRQGYGPRKDDPQWGPTPEFAFRLLWDSLNEKRGFGWDTNPWIVALTFQPHLANVDDLLRGGPSA